MTPRVTSLGAINKTSTKGLFEALWAVTNISVIGQYDIGFYYAYLVAVKVVMIIKHNDDQYAGESSIGTLFTVCGDHDNLIGPGYQSDPSSQR
jgi:HSP90 family molecular chaperone